MFVFLWLAHLNVWAFVIASLKCLSLWLAYLNVCDGHLRKVFRSWVASPVSQNFPVALDPHSHENRLPLTSHLSWHVPPLRQGLFSQHPFWQSTEGVSDWKNSKTIQRNLRKKIAGVTSNFYSNNLPFNDCLYVVRDLAKPTTTSGKQTCAILCDLEAFCDFNDLHMLYNIGKMSQWLAWKIYFYRRTCLVVQT